MINYIKAIEINPKFTQYASNLVNLCEQLNYTEAQFEGLLKKNPKIANFDFFISLA
jgi:hypothetical protein